VGGRQVPQREPGRSIPQVPPFLRSPNPKKRKGLRCHWPGSPLIAKLMIRKPSELFDNFL